MKNTHETQRKWRQQMSKLTHKLLLTIATAVLLLAGSVFNIYAQDKPAGSQRTPRATPTPSPTPLSPLPNSRSKIGQAGKTQFDPGIFGLIRWKIEMGLPSTDSGRTPAQINCGAIRVRATVQDPGAPGTFGQEREVGHYRIQDAPIESNGYYVCSYSFTDRSNPNDELNLPRHRAIAVAAKFGSYTNQILNDILASKPWFGPGQPQPPPGYQRVVIGGRGITLTDSAPRVTVDFEVVYRPVPAPPR
jgi:hypothetical protein